MRDDRLTSPDQFVPEMHLVLRHMYYGEDNYVVVGLPYKKYGDQWHVQLLHEGCTKPVEHSLNELGVTEDKVLQWVETRGIIGE